MHNEFSWNLSAIEKYINGAISAESIIQNNTFFPFYSPFLSRERKKKMYQIMLSSNKNKFTGNLGIKIKRKTNFWVCETCVKEDIKRYGETYWHRIHQNGQRVPEHEAFYKKYFTVKSTPKQGAQITVNHQMVEKAKRYYGYFSLLSNEKMDAIQALELYRGKDPIEKCFGDIKERLNLRRMLVSSEATLDGKLFVSFVGLILLAQIKKKMQAQKLFKDYTIQSLFDKLDVIEAFESLGQALRVGEILTAQKKIYEALGVPLPSDV